MIWQVGYDGMAMPVEAVSKQEAKDKAESYLAEQGYKISFITVTEASEGYQEWIKGYEIQILI